MTIKIIQKGNKVLRQKAKEIPLEEIKSKKIKDVLKQMSQALSKCKDGVALAAPQIGISLRIFIIDKNSLIHISERKEGKKKIEPWIFINPIIKKISKKKNIVAEGCLSIKGVYGTIKRAEKLTVEAYDKNGKRFIRSASGLLAQIIQHEIDHLNGVLFTDRATNLEKAR